MEVVALAMGGGTVPPDDAQTWIARSELGFFAVTGPIGRSLGGAAYALAAISTALPSSMPTLPGLEPAECSQLRAAILSSQGEWQDRISADPSLRGIGAAFAGVLLKQNRAAIAHLGDCRVYQVRQDRFHRQTVEHRLADPRHRRIITRGFGMNSNPEVVLWEVNQEDAFLLTSGVHDVLTDGELLAPVLELSPPDAARAILNAAVSRGAVDHQTVLIVRPGTKSAD